MEDSFEILKNKIEKNEARMAVVGLGYVGLPLATVFAEAGYPVTGIDLDPIKTEKVNRGESYIPDIETARIRKLREKKLLQAT
ncbi:MAG: UDP-N-acetyl-D-glucosamine dehydrogenase, partial [Flexilinea sp.]|nr:UDP-N-acetyl-D-glucosamine dehydrogenase [Flexilinea sp.]